MNTLLSIYIKHKGKSSIKWSSYLNEYDQIFHKLRDKPLKILEIGVQNGGSLEIWCEYFNNAAVVVGCDINPDCSILTYDDRRIKLVIGDANTDEIEDKIRNISEKFDLIVDDGSHKSSDIVKTFSRYLPILADGGLFIVEDLHCSYWEGFGGGLYYPYSSIAFFKKLIDVINYSHWGVEKKIEDLLSGFSNKLSTKFDESEFLKISRIEFTNSICIVKKKGNGSNSLGNLVAAGNREMVVSGHKKMQGNSAFVFPQEDNTWSILKSAPEESWEGLSNIVFEQNNRILSLEKKLEESDTKLISVCSSKSWKLTEPLRLVGSLFRKLKIFFG